MPEPPTDDEIQRLVETQPGMLDQAAGLLKKLLAKEITPRTLSSRLRNSRSNWTRTSLP